MKMHSAAAALAALALAAPPAAAQWGRAPSGSGGSFKSVPHSGTAPFRSYAPGNFPVPGLPAIASGVESRIAFGRGRFFRHHRPERPDRPDRPDRPRKRDRHDRADNYGYGYGIGFGGLIDPDRGYFSTGGDAPEVDGGHVRYDYDRGYPYDFYSRPAEREIAYGAAPRERYCTTQWTRGRRSDERVPVRVCRN